MNNQVDQNSGQHCRLCLHWIDVALCAEQLVDIFSFNENLNSTLADKIRDCIGLNINPGGAESRICLNCEHTINFIDEFRMLCQQTERIQKSSRFRFNDAWKWQCYKNNIRELRALVENHRDCIDNIFDDTVLGNSTVFDDDVDIIFSPEFIKIEEGGIENEEPEEINHVDSLMEAKKDVKPKETEVEPSEPNVEPSEPDVKPSESGMEPREPNVEPNESGVEPREPDVESNESDVIPNESDVEPNEPDVEAGEPDVDPNEADVVLNEPDKEPNEPHLKANKYSDNVKSKNTREYKNWNAQLKLEMARELEAQTSDKPKFKTVAEKLNLPIDKIKEMWVYMKNYYRTRKKLAHVGHQASVFRCRSCPLFKVLNIIVPKFDGDKPYDERESSTVRNNKGKLTIDQKLTIAEEMRTHPELWDFSINCSTQSRGIIWKETSRKLAMDVATLRTHWDRLRGVYRNYRVREVQGIKKREPANESYDRLISVLHGMLGNTMSIRTLEKFAKQTSVSEGDVGNVIEKSSEKDNNGGKQSIDQEVSIIDEVGANPADLCRERTSEKEENVTAKLPISSAKQKDMLEGETGTDVEKENSSKQLALVQEVQKYPFIWCYGHSDYKNRHKRNETWEKIAEIFATDREDVRVQWGRLRSTYCKRYLRLMEGQLRSDHYLIDDPLYKVLDKMLRENTLDLSKGETGTDVEEENGSIRLDKDGPRLALAQEIQKYPFIWCNEHSDYINTEKRNQTWEKIAEMFATDRKEVKRHWRGLRGIYRNRYVRLTKGQYKSDHYLIDNPLYKVLDKMLQENASLGLKGKQKNYESKRKIYERKRNKEENSSKLKFAKICYDNEILWNTNHPDYGAMNKRNKVWESVASEFGVSLEGIKQEWRRLRDMYRTRCVRSKNGPVEKDNILLMTPLDQLLKSMFEEHMQIGTRSHFVGRKKKKSCIKATQGDTIEKETKEEDSSELKFAKVCYDNEILWNTNHPDYGALNKRNKVWETVASEFGVSLEEIKQEWRRLRDMYRTRCVHSKNSPVEKDNILLMTPLDQLLKSMFEEHMQIGAQSLFVDRKKKNSSTKATQGDTIERKPFNTTQDRIKLVEEISKHELIWNKKNRDYKKSALREIQFEKTAAKFGHPSSVIKEEWLILKRMHRSRKKRIAAGTVDATQDGLEPLHVLLDNLLSPKPRASGDDVPMSDEDSYPKRQFHGRRAFNNDGCVKVNVNGTLQYVKVCELCGKQVERSYFEDHMNDHYGLTPYTCPFEGCDKKFSNRTNRNRHKEVHNRDAFYTIQCDLCDKKFRNKCKFKLHYAVHHKSEELPCNICGKVLQHKQILKKHLRIHASNYECHVCGKVLKKKYSLSIHMRIHTKEKPYPCDHCEGRFMLKVQLKTHLLKVHDIVLEQLQATATANKS